VVSWSAGLLTVGPGMVFGVGTLFYKMYAFISYSECEQGQKKMVQNGGVASDNKDRTRVR